MDKLDRNLAEAQERLAQKILSERSSGFTRQEARRALELAHTHEGKHALYKASKDPRFRRTRMHPTEYLFRAYSKHAPHLNLGRSIERKLKLSRFGNMKYGVPGALGLKHGVIPGLAIATGKGASLLAKGLGGAITYLGKGLANFAKNEQEAMAREAKAIVEGRARVLDIDELPDGTEGALVALSEDKKTVLAFTERGFARIPVSKLIQA